MRDSVLTRDKAIGPGVSVPISPFLRDLRDKVGHDLLILPSATVAVFDALGRLLLAQDAQSRVWMTIGGLIEPGETPADAGVRECWEETGLLVELVRLVGVFGGPHFRIKYSNGDVASYVATVFEGRQIGGSLRPDASETAVLRYVTRSDAAALPMAPWTKEMVAHAFERGASPYFVRPTWTPATRETKVDR